MQGINRRNALKTGLLTAVAAGAGMAHAETKTDAARTATYDLVVIGAGAPA